MSIYYLRLCVRIMMATVSFAIKEIEKLDCQFQDLIKNRDLVIQWIIDEGGPSFFFEIKNGKFECFQNQEHANPDIKISIHSLKTAMKIFNNPLSNFQEEIKAKNITIEGLDGKTEQFFPILEYIQDYLIDMRS